MGINSRRVLQLIILGVCASFIMGQVVPLGDPDARTARRQETVIYNGEQGDLINSMGLIHFTRAERPYSGQTVIIELFYFQTSEDAFSLFTFLQEPGAKSFSGKVECYLQGSNLITWQGTCVSRSTFERWPVNRLSGYVDWVETQTGNRAPFPAIFTHLPARYRYPATSRFITRDFLVPRLWPMVSGPSFQLTGGRRLSVAQYRRGTDSYWAGWLTVKDTGAEAGFPREGWLEIGAEPGNNRFCFKKAGQRWAIFYGPHDDELAELVIADLESNWGPGRFSGADQTDDRYFKRDDYGYGAIIWAGVRLVLIFAAVAAAMGLVVHLLRVGVRKIRRQRSGLAQETVCHLELSGGSDSATTQKE